MSNQRNTKTGFPLLKISPSCGFSSSTFIILRNYHCWASSICSKFQQLDEPTSTIKTNLQEMCSCFFSKLFVEAQMPLWLQCLLRMLQQPANLFSFKSHRESDTLNPFSNRNPTPLMVAFKPNLKDLLFHLKIFIEQTMLSLFHLKDVLIKSQSIYMS